MPARSRSASVRPLRIGFLPLTDAAPLIVAESHGIFARHGVSVELRREVGWATIREKVRLGELDGAHAPAAMLWALELGLGCPPCRVLTAFILNLNGNALTLARSLGEEARSSEGLREIVRKRRGAQVLTIGTVYPYSSHNLLIREWLDRSGLAVEKDVRIAVVPPAQMFRNLVAGTIDGYAAGEPWNSIAVNENVGWCPLWSAALRPPQIEKVLLVTQKFAQARTAEHLALVASLAEAAEWCDTPTNRGPLAKLLAEPKYVGLPEHLIAPTLLGRFDAGCGTVESVPDFHIFHAGNSNVPTALKAAGIQAALQHAALIPRQNDLGLPQGLFREDIYAEALSRRLRPVT